jgi:hypothetical protein
MRVEKFIVEMQAAAFVFIIVSLTIFREGKFEKYFLLLQFQFNDSKEEEKLHKIFH